MLEQQGHQTKQISFTLTAQTHYKNGKTKHYEKLYHIFRNRGAYFSSTLTVTLEGSLLK